MKTTKLLIGICGAVMALAAFAAPAPAQVAGGSAGGGGAGRHLIRLVRPIIYDYDAAAPNPTLRHRHLRILADGAATLVDGAGMKVRVLKRRIKPAEMAELDDLVAQLDQPGDVSTGAAADGQPGLTLTVGAVGVRKHVTMGRPIARKLVRKLDRIVADLAAE